MDDGTRRRGPKVSQGESGTSAPSSGSTVVGRRPLSKRSPAWLRGFFLLAALGVFGLKTWKKVSKTKINSDSPNVSGERFFTKAELKQYSSDNQDKLFLSVLGQVFDVTKGRRFYGGEGGYSGFAGKDASRAFISGKFNEDGLVEEVEGLGNEDIMSLLEWRDFYHNDYKYVGKIVDGLYYDRDGKPTKALEAVDAQALLAKSERNQEEALEKINPNCNSRWSQKEGGKIWCDGDRYPRKTFVKQRGSETVFRCACFADPNFYDTERHQLYPNCEPTATWCQTSPPPPK